MTRFSNLPDPVLTDRRHLLKTSAAVAAAALLPSNPGEAQEAAPTEEPLGGTLRVAIVGEPPYSADATYTSATLTRFIANHVFEGLFAFDAEMNPQPMLISDYSLSEDKRTYTFALRKNVFFRDGTRLHANDVQSSLIRWGAMTSAGQQVFSLLSSMTVVDAHSIELAFARQIDILPHLLAGTDALIVPAYVANQAPVTPMSFTWMHGTGPYQLVESETPGVIRIERFEGYQSINVEPSGMAGKKVAWLAAIEFIEVSDPVARVNGLLDGTYHFAESIPPDALPTLDADPSIQTLIASPFEWSALHFNMKRGRFVGERMRRAVQLAFSQQEAAMAAFGREDFVRINPSISGEESPWFSVAGAEAYNVPDIAQAQALLKETGYAGQPVRMLTTREYPHNYALADFIRTKLEAIGIVVELEVSDWATLVEERNDPRLYELFVGGNIQQGHPVTQPFNNPAWAGFWENSAKDSAVTDMLIATSDEAMSAAVDTWTTWIWNDLPFVKICDNVDVRAHRREVLGYQNMPAWTFWNVTLEGEETPEV